MRTPGKIDIMLNGLVAFNRKAAAKDANISERQAKQMIRVASVPDDQAYADVVKPAFHGLSSPNAGKVSPPTSP